MAYDPPPVRNRRYEVPNDPNARDESVPSKHKHRDLLCHAVSRVGYLVPFGNM